MQLRLEIIWYGFFEFCGIYVSHVGIVVRVGKLVWVRMGKVGGLIFGMMVWISRRVPQRLPAQSGVTLP